jgi:DNA-binding NarL/FixJ family response regulator
MTFSDIGRRLGVSVRTVHADYRRAVQKLKEARKNHEQTKFHPAAGICDGAGHGGRGSDGYA